MALTTINRPDDQKALFGTGDDLEIYHDGSDSYVKDAGTGELRLEADAGGVRIQRANGDTGLYYNVGGQVELYYNGDAKFKTETHGCTSNFSGANTFTIGSTNAAGVHLVLDGDSNGDGVGSDYSSIIHDSSGDLTIHANCPGNDSSFYLKVKDGTASAIDAITAAGVKLYYDGNLKAYTTSGGFKVDNKLELPDGGATGTDARITVGTSDDLRIYHEAGGNSYIRNETGELRTRADDFRVCNNANSQTLAYFNAGAQCELYHNNVKKLFTEVNGISVCGDGSAGYLKIRDVNENLRGVLHASSTADIGFISTSMSSWLYRVESDGDYQHYGSAISDRDRKDNITTLSGTSLDKVTKLVPKTYTWKQDDTGKVPTDKVFVGFIAQEVKEHLPDIVKGTDGQNNMAVDYNGILAHAVKAITELSAEVETLKTKVAALEAK